MFGFFLSCCVLLCGARGFAQSLPPDLTRDGAVRFFVYHTDTFVEIRYADKDGKWLPDAEEKLRRLFYSRGDGGTLALDRRLVELADHVQDRFGADTVEVISAYRSPEFNRELKEAGRNVADESFHTKGLAMDVHLDEIDETSLRDYLLSLKLGGVGYYGNKLMVHMDFGPARRWQDGGFVQNTEIGIFNANNPLKIRTDKLYYAEGEYVSFRFAPAPKGKPRLTLQKFFRGEWRQAQKWEDRPVENPWRVHIPREDGPELSRFGKFRLRCESGATWQNSNEFYVKKK